MHVWSKQTSAETTWGLLLLRSKTRVFCFCFPWEQSPYSRVLKFLKQISSPLPSNANKPLRHFTKWEISWNPWTSDSAEVSAILVHTHQEKKKGKTYPLPRQCLKGGVWILRNQSCQGQLCLARGKAAGSAVSHVRKPPRGWERWSLSLPPCPPFGQSVPRWGKPPTAGDGISCS